MHWFASAQDFRLCLLFSLLTGQGSMVTVVKTKSLYPAGASLAGYKDDEDLGPVEVCKINAVWFMY